MPAPVAKSLAELKEGPSAIEAEDAPPPIIIDATTISTFRRMSALIPLTASTKPTTMLKDTTT
jgi:hypothetical protein